MEFHEKAQASVVSHCLDVIALTTHGYHGF